MRVVFEIFVQFEISGDISTIIFNHIANFQHYSITQDE